MARAQGPLCPPSAQTPNFAMVFVGPKPNPSRRGSIGHEGVREFRPPKVGRFHTKCASNWGTKAPRTFDGGRFQRPTMVRWGSP